MFPGGDAHAYASHGREPHCVATITVAVTLTMAITVATATMIAIAVAVVATGRGGTRPRVETGRSYDQSRR